MMSIKDLNLKKRIILWIISSFLIFSFLPALLYVLYAQKSNLQTSKDRLLEYTQRNSSEIDHNLKDLEIFGGRIAGSVTAYLDSNISDENSNVEISRVNNAWRSTDGYSAAFLSNRSPLSEDRKRDFARTEKLWRIISAPALNHFFNIYLITHDDFIRIHPPKWAMDVESDHDFSEDIFYKLAAPDENPDRNAVWTPVYYDSLWQKQMTSLLIPIYLDNGREFKGVLGFDLTTETLFHKVDILNDNSEIISSTLLDSEFKAVMEISPATKNALSAVQLDNDPDLSEAGRPLKLFTAGEILFSCRKLAAFDWYFFTYIGKSELFKEINKGLLNVLLFIIITSIAVGIIINRGVDRVILRRLSNLAQVVSYVGEGKLDQNISIERKDEIGILETGIADMIEGIGQHMEKLNSSSDELTRIHNIYQTVIRSAKGAVYINNYQDQKFEYIDDKVLEIFEDRANLKEPSDFTPGYLKKHLKQIVVTDPDQPPHMDTAQYIRDYKNCKFNHYYADMEIVFSDGRSKWLSDASVPFEIRDGKVTKSMGILQDITDRRKAESELKKSQQEFLSIYENISDVYFKSDFSNAVEIVSPSAIELFGLGSIDDIIGREIKEFFYDPEEYHTFKKDLYENKELRNYPLKLKKKNGSPVHVQTNSKLIYSKAKEKYFSIGTLRDVSDTIFYNQELSKLTQAVSQIPLSIVITDLKGSIEYVNPYFEKTTGYSNSEIIGNHSRILKSGHQNDDFYKDLWETITAGKTWQGEFHNKKKDGTYYWEKAHISPIFNADGSFNQFIAIKENITEQKKLQSMLNHSQKMESIGQLAGGVAHDFNNILTAQNGFTELLASMVSDDTMKMLVEQIKAGNQRAENLVRQLLTFSRKQESKPQKILLNESVMNLEKMLRRMIKEDINLIFDLDDDLYPVKADPSQLEQVIVNLMVNARDAINSAGGRHKTISLKTANFSLSEEMDIHNDRIPPGNYATFTIEDSGTGIDTQILKNMFEPFFTTKEEGHGTGLGLATVFGIIKQNKAFIDVFTELGKGSSFSVFWPALEDSGSDEKLDTSAGKKLMGGNEHILFVEDDELTQQAMSINLISLGYNVSTAGDGRTALEMINADPEKYDLIITDLTMPRLGGIDLALTVRKKQPGSKFIFCSGYIADTQKRHNEILADIPFIKKPYKIDEINEMIRKILDKKEV